MISALLAGGDLGWAAVGVALRALWYASGLVGSGLAFFALLHSARQDPADRARLRRWAAVAAGMALAAGLSGLAAQVMVLTDGAAAFDAEAWGIVAESRSGLTVAVGAAGLLLVVLLQASSTGILLPALGGALFACSHALLGHTTMLVAEPLPGILVAVHVAVAAWWVGSLFPLAWAAQRQGPAAGRPVRGSTTWCHWRPPRRHRRAEVLEVARPPVARRTTVASPPASRSAMLWPTTTGWSCGASSGAATRGVSAGWPRARTSRSGR